MIKGYYINLESSKKRNEAVLNNLKALGLEQNYQRFNAIKGEPSEAAKLNLRPGELGLWKSWIELLGQETRNTKKNYRYLHIIEDDVIMNQTTITALGILAKQEKEFDMLFTDMYVNPSIHVKLGKACKKLMQKGTVNVETNIYTGCTSSVLIKDKAISKIYGILSGDINEKGKKIPLDNYIRRLMVEKKLTILTTLPFTTSIRLDEIQNSTIQETKLNLQVISDSQALCGLMRRDLSYIKNPDDLHIKVGQYIKTLEDYASEEGSKEKSEDIMDIVSEYCLNNKLLRYKYDQRLLKEAMNGQAEENLE